MWMGCDSISIMRKCAWCGEDFPVKSLFSRDKYCDLHKKEAAKSKTLKRYVKYYKRNKRHEVMRTVGTITNSPHPRIGAGIYYLGVKIPFSEFVEEQRIITNMKKGNNSVSTIYKGKKTNNNVWIDNCKTLEYGEPQPTGIQNTHNYATLDDYYHTAKYYLLKNKGTCPQCGCKDHYKTDIDVSCAECGLILESNTNLMGWTHKDVTDSQVFETTVQEVAWNKYWIGE